MIWKNKTNRRNINEQLIIVDTGVLTLSIIEYLLFIMNIPVRYIHRGKRV